MVEQHMPFTGTDFNKHNPARGFYHVIREPGLLLIFPTSPRLPAQHPKFSVQTERPYNRISNHHLQPSLLTVGFVSSHLRRHPNLLQILHRAPLEVIPTRNPIRLLLDPLHKISLVLLSKLR